MQRQYHIESSIFQGLGRRKDIWDMKFEISLRILGEKRFRVDENGRFHNLALFFRLLGDFECNRDITTNRSSLEQIQSWFYFRIENGQARRCRQTQTIAS